MLEEEDLKELGVSFRGRKILRKLIEELKWYVIVFVHYAVVFYVVLEDIYMYTGSVVSEL